MVEVGTGGLGSRLFTNHCGSISIILQWANQCRCRVDSGIIPKALILTYNQNGQCNNSNGFVASFLRVLHWAFPESELG